MSASLVGSEMCIRDRAADDPWVGTATRSPDPLARISQLDPSPAAEQVAGCLLYTSDAADDM
eukprot:12784227-Alexandrium_andersonii.AAC.1